MPSLKELIAQKEALELEIERTRHKDRSEAIGKVRALMQEYGLSAGDLTDRGAARPPPVKSGANAGRKVAAKYRDPATGDSWSGRGLQPKWLKAALQGGRKLGDFLV